ncbi:VanZ family protein [Brucepastera parasyntrophica]|uniref:VanZ family protein n=1 Tax=Brucepastera parasyntrophica TaxID=2880008 RepID=UPI0021087FBB|nr:VanZ family protein [Brucepastera parasyntrophica]ULQ59873.1 VanZ family protein [Brucepastera parasyntrophica]
MFENRIFKIIAKIPALIVIAAIWFLSSQSTLPQPKGILGIDKIQHIIAFAVLAVSISFWFPAGQWKQHSLRTIIIIIGITSAYGAVDEIHQYFVPGRDCNIWDWLADTIGAVVGTVLSLIVIKFKIRSREIKNQVQMNYRTDK